MDLEQVTRNYRTSPLGVASLNAPEIELIPIRTTSARVLGPLSYGEAVLVYAASMPINAALGNLFVVTPTDAVDFAFEVPINSPGAGFSQSLSIKIINTTGAPLGAATFTAGAGGFRLAGAWVQPATANSRTVTFLRDAGSNVWAEVSRSAADVPN